MDVITKAQIVLLYTEHCDAHSEMGYSMHNEDLNPLISHLDVRRCENVRVNLEESWI